MKLNRKRLFFILGCCYLTIIVFCSIYQYGHILSRIQSICRDRELGFWNYNIIPFKTISYQIAKPYLRYQFVRSFLTYIPLGIFLAYIYKKTWVGIIISGGIIFAKEALQFATLTGYFDIDDIIVNLSGTLVGMIFYWLVDVFVHLIIRYNITRKNGH